MTEAQELLDRWFVPLSIREGPRWVRWVWLASNPLTWNLLWKLRVARWLACRVGDFCRRHS